VLRVNVGDEELGGISKAKLAGKAYTAMFNPQPGGEFEIKLGKKQIRLVPVGDSDKEGLSALPACYHYLAAQASRRTFG
jgi:hypothetical protein